MVNHLVFRSDDGLHLAGGAGDWAFQGNVFICYLFFFQLYGSLFFGYTIEYRDIAFPQERPRNHLDMRHRLDSKGQREGKLIDYTYVYLNMCLNTLQFQHLY